MIHPHMNFKTDTVRSRYQYLSETAQEVAYEMSEWAEERKLPFLITETVTTLEEDQALERLSATHRSARAFDISVRGWIDLSIREFISYFEPRFLHVAAYGGKAKEAKLIVRHDSGHGDHMHVQISGLFAVKDPLAKTRQA